MASTQEILDDARKLGEKIAEHDTTRKLERALKALDADTKAQRALNDYHRHIQAIAEKEQQGKPIEVADKKKLTELQNVVVTNAALRDFQVAQMDYMDLLRKVDEAMTGEVGLPEETTGGPGGAGAAAQSPLVNPDLGF